MRPRSINLPATSRGRCELGVAARRTGTYSGTRSAQCGRRRGGEEKHGEEETPFEREWVRTQITQPRSGEWIETGVRPSEHGSGMATQTSF